MTGTTEAFSRVKIDALLADAGWNLTDGVSVLFEHALPGGASCWWRWPRGPARPARRGPMSRPTLRMGASSAPPCASSSSMRPPAATCSIGEGWLAPYRIYKAMRVKTAADGGFQVWCDELGIERLSVAPLDVLPEFGPPGLVRFMGWQRQ